MNPMNYPQIYDIIKNMNVPKDQVPGLLAYLAQPNNLNQIYDEVLISPEIGTGRLPRIDNINKLVNEYLPNASTTSVKPSLEELATATGLGTYENTLDAASSAISGKPKLMAFENPDYNISTISGNLSKEAQSALDEVFAKTVTSPDYGTAIGYKPYSDGSIRNVSLEAIYDTKSRIPGGSHTFAATGVTPASYDPLQQPKPFDTLKVNSVNKGTAAKSAKKETSLFARLTGGKQFNDIFGEGKSIGGNLGLPKIGQAVTDIQNTDLMGLGKIKNISNLGSTAIQGGIALKGLGDIAGTQADLQDLANDIKTSAYNNPLYSSYLNADEKRLLRQLKTGNGGVTNGWNGVGQGIVQSIPKALIGAVAGGLTGGPAGAVINGLGGLINGGIKGYNQGAQENTSKLQSLYDTLSNAENDYNSMRRPRNLSIAGLQSAAYRNYY